MREAPHMQGPGSTGREQVADAIVRCIDANDLARGAALARELNARHPDYPYGWYLASFLARKARRYPEAVQAIDRALLLGPTDRYALHRIKCLFDMGELPAARMAAKELDGRDFGEPSLHGEFGTLLHQLSEHATALSQYDRALRLDPRSAGNHFNRAALLRYLGDGAGAEAGFDDAIAANPDEYEAYNGRANARTQTRERNHVEELRQAIARTRDSTGLIQLHFALAKELEDLGDPHGAFDSLAAGAGLKRRQMRYRVETDLQILARIRETYDPGLFDGHVQGFESTDPIFIIGMPRTGTTLVERILSNHSAVCSAGELNHFSLALIPKVQQAPRAWTFARSARLT